MISAVILTKNEEENIGKCLESVRWCYEIIVVDDNSTDNTLEIAKKYKAKIFSRPLDLNFSSQRNFGLSKTKNEWVLFVDADEILSEALTYEIQGAIGLSRNLDNFNGFFIKRSDFLWGKQLKYGETGGIKLLRLARKGHGFWEGAAHESWKIDGPVGNLKNPLLHFPHKTIEEFLKEINFYTDLRAKELGNKQVKVYFYSVLLYPLGKFFINYFVRRGFMDGIRGLILAVIMSFHSFLVRGKLWILQDR